MVKKKKSIDFPPSKAYLVSFGDTMTALLAFFIVLLSLAEEQSGANLYSGTGSFVKNTDAMGLPGKINLDTSSRAIQLESASPQYLVKNPQDRSDPGRAKGPDEEDNSLRVIDRESEMFQRFLNEIEGLGEINQLPEVKGEAAFDFFNPINQQSPVLSDVYKVTLKRFLPLLRKPGNELEITVWATTPNPTAWKRAADQASSILDELIKIGRLKKVQIQRIRTVGRPWIYSDMKRPVLSVMVYKTNTAASN